MRIGSSSGRARQRERCVLPRRVIVRATPTVDTFNGDHVFWTRRSAFGIRYMTVCDRGGRSGFPSSTLRVVDVSSECSTTCKYIVLLSL